MFEGALAACTVLPPDAWTSLGMEQTQLVSVLQAAAKAMQVWKEHQDKTNSVEAAKIAAETADATATQQAQQQQQQLRDRKRGEAVASEAARASNGAGTGVASVPGGVVVGDDAADGVDAALGVMDTDERFKEWTPEQCRGFVEQVLGAAKRRKVEE